MKHRTTLHTVRDVIDAFGGPKVAAAWADVGQTAVCNWINREFIPPGWHYRMAAHLGAKGYEIDPVVFGYEEPLVAATRRASSASQKTA